jgi:hypothetical protein
MWSLLSYLTSDCLRDHLIFASRSHNDLVRWRLGMYVTQTNVTKRFKPISWYPVRARNARIRVMPHEHRRASQHHNFNTQ